MLAIAEMLGKRNQITMITPPDHMLECEAPGRGCCAVGDAFSKVAASGDIAYYRKQIEEQFTQHLKVYESADMIIGGGLFYAGRTLAEYFGKPYYHLFFTPQVLRSAEYAPVGVKRPFRGKTRNKLLWMKSMKENDLILKAPINRRRKELGLAPVGSIYRYFIDRPGTVVALDDELAEIPGMYEPYIRQIHTLRYEDRSPLGGTLRAFLENGSKPVLIGFGGAEYAGRGFPGLLKNAVDTVIGLGFRAVVISETAATLYPDHEYVFRCPYAPHAALLPRVAVIIHHGGIGTVCAALRSGTPQVIIPQAMDQFFWAEVVQRKKWGEAFYAGSRSFSSQLRDAVEHVGSDPEIRESVADASRWMNGAQYREESMRKLQAAMPACFEQAE